MRWNWDGGSLYFWKKYAKSYAHFEHILKMKAHSENESTFWNCQVMFNNFLLQTLIMLHWPGEKFFRKHWQSIDCYIFHCKLLQNFANYFGFDNLQLYNWLWYIRKTFVTTSASEIVLVTSSVSHHDFDHNVLFYCKHETQLSSPFETLFCLFMKVRRSLKKGSIRLFFVTNPFEKV